MKLLRLQVDGFGPLAGEFVFAPDRLTLVVGENERGKSSLLAAISAALYGLEGDRRSHRVLTPVERWRPWSGDRFRVELEFEGGGERLTVMRDFQRETVAVWNEGGQERTHEFREGKDQFPIGKKLFGLDADEFAKCAFVRQGELDHVVATEERVRRNSLLQARLESAADTRIGDANAIEAIRVLEDAAARYTCPELPTTLKVDTAIHRLKTQREFLANEIHTLCHDLETMQGPLEELARITDEEHQSRAELRRIETERRSLRLAEARARLEHHEQRRAELDRLQAEAATLEPFSRTPAESESELKAAVARLEEAEHQLEALEAERRRTEEEHRRLEMEFAGLEIYAALTARDSDQLTARAAEIRIVDQEHERLRGELDRSRGDLAAQGFEFERVELLGRRFGALEPDATQLLRTQPGFEVEVQTEIAEIEKLRTASSETLRSTDAVRSARRAPGWLLFAAGLGAALAAGVAGSLRTDWPWLPVLGGGGGLAIVSLMILVLASRARRAERDAARLGLHEAEERTAEVRARRTENGSRLAALAISLGYANPHGLLREWGDYSRLIEQGRAVHPIQQRITLIERQRELLADEAGALLERVGGGPTEPEHIELTAAGIRQRLDAGRRLEDSRKRWSALLERVQAAGALVSQREDQAEEILRSAGIVHDPGRTWTELIEALSLRGRAAARYTRLVLDLIPPIERDLLDPRALEELRSRIAALEPEAAARVPDGDPSRNASLETEADRLRAEIDELARRRGELRPDFEQRSRSLHARRLEREAERERIEQALERAERFKRAVEMAVRCVQDAASDTHRRWAEFLNHRVTELLRAFGTGIEQVRFGEDLDFSLRFMDGQQMARGKALLQLSAGARDQIHLAVRLAISEYLSRGREPLPLLIDDAFATSDDERARAGMRLLIEHFAPHHQVIVVTCHRSRYEALAACDRDLYAGRVQWIEARRTEAQA